LYCTHFFESCIRAPQTEEEIKNAMAPYAQRNMNGCIASTDGVHIRWDKCPQSQKVTHKGKEGYPTRGFNVSGLHTGQIVSVTPGFSGT
jgi:hypothetical protein